MKLCISQTVGVCERFSNLTAHFNDLGIFLKDQYLDLSTGKF